LHVLDIAENSVAAGAGMVEIAVEEDSSVDRLTVSVEDDGKGMDEQTLCSITDPFVTSRSTRVAGLGIPFLKAAAEACNGGLDIVSVPGKGTRLVAEFERGHIDLVPLGDLASTVLTLVVGFPDVRWLLRYRVDGESFTFDSEPIGTELGEIPWTQPSVLRYVREMLEGGVARVQRTAPQA